MKFFLTALLLLSSVIGFATENLTDKPLDFSTSGRRPKYFMTCFISVEKTNDEEVIIELSDGSSWKVDKNFLEALQEWDAGDEIRWLYDSNLESYLLKNIRTKSTLLAQLDFSNSLENAYTVKDIEKKGRVIELDFMGYQWYVGWMGSFTSCEWRPGDRVIINKSDYEAREQYTLLNIDTKTHVWASLVEWRHHVERK